MQLFTREQHIAWTVRRITYLMEGRYRRKTAALAVDLGVSRQTLYAWKRGATAPSGVHEDRLQTLYERVKHEDEKAD